MSEGNDQDAGKARLSLRPAGRMELGRTVDAAAGFNAGDSGADGTAGDGAAIVGVTVLVTDATGKTVTAVTDSNGYYRVKVTNFTPPFVAQLTKLPNRLGSGRIAPPFHVCGKSR